MLDLGSPDTREHLIEYIGTSCVAHAHVEIVNVHVCADNVEHLEVLGGLQQFAEALCALRVLIVVHLSLELDADALAIVLAII